MAIIKTLSIEIEGAVMQVTGGEFYDMLDSIKAIQGRRWDGDRKLWVLPCSLNEVSAILAKDGFSIFGNEDDVIAAEVLEIEDTRSRLIENRELVQSEISRLDEQRAGYSFRTKSRIAAGIARDAACLRGALKAIDKSSESLTEVEIRSMQRACKILEIK